MKVEQIHALMNVVTNEVLGKTDLVKEDLSNIIIQDVPLRIRKIVA